MSREKRNAGSVPLPDGDDGRTIADMNVEGMPWYTPPAPEERAGTGHGAPQTAWESEPLSREERRHYILGAVLAALAVAAVFGLAYFLFLWFCTGVWLR